MKAFAVVAGVVGMAHAHMNLAYPACIGRKDNINTGNGKEFGIDSNINAPLDPSGSDYPCKVPGFSGIQVKTPPQMTWERGANYPVGLGNEVVHGGGSCQFALSKDRGKTSTVIASYIGNCAANIQDRNFTVAIPCDTPEGEWLFMWSWHNRIGNREMYQRCTYLNIKGGGCGNKCGGGGQRPPVENDPVIPPSSASPPAPAPTTPAVSTSAPGDDGTPSTPAYPQPTETRPVHCYAGRKRSIGHGHGHGHGHMRRNSLAIRDSTLDTRAKPGPAKGSKYDAAKCACVPFEGRPSIFIANIKDKANPSSEELCTNENTDVIYPDPGPAACVEYTSDNPYPPGKKGTCQWRGKGEGANL
ncbi:hypothetical protein JDV02_010355 [Purpureocillium takamizusanense]|uniref:Lytic polysaccharide monooxygenase n=1 Tax=Purpureocillium takamizusanense TaxID=2060973 RepID=A0A9Q8VGJ2_9HYPO|nr:uncharacterized protein JDV02_010355 [Purpureocillium takamizusanense]UNI24621.1 hypothetical protein JDV02_010355 [Purpureocillium takamizusanense]